MGLSSWISWKIASRTYAQSISDGQAAFVGVAFVVSRDKVVASFRIATAVLVEVGKERPSSTTAGKKKDSEECHGKR